MRLIRVAALIFAAVACTLGSSPGASPQPPSGVAGPASSARASPSPTTTLMFSVGPDQARYVATVVAFVDAFNTGDTQTALNLLTPDVTGGDCDYGRSVMILFRGKSEAEAWLRGRAAEHDRMEIEEISNSNPDPATGSQVVGVAFKARQSDLLPKPIVPAGAAKVVFTKDGRQIRAFANAGASCRPA